MSTSCEAIAAGSPNVQPFAYEEIPIGPQAGRSPGCDDSQAVALREAQWLDQGRREGEAAAALAFEQRLAAERNAVASALAAFRRDRDEYFRNIESEVVQFALAIARKILHREAHMDPLLLAGMVRIALDKLQAHTQVTVHVHPLHVLSWREYFAGHRELCDLLEVVEDASVDPHACILRTTLGSTELGIEPQLKEVEQGLFDLLEQRSPSEP